MASPYTGLGIEKMTTGENAGNWGTTTNTNLQIIEQMVGGYVEKAVTSTPTTLSVSDGSTGAELSHRIIKFTGTISADTVVTVPLDVQQMYILLNGTSGNYTVTFKYVSGSGSTVVFKGTDKGTKLVYATADDGTNPNMVDTGIGSHQIHNTLTVGIDDTGYDVKFFGATASAYMLWDESTDDLVLAGAAGIDLAGDIDVDGTANLDAVDIDGAVQIDAAFTSGVDGQGYDTKFFGDTSSAYMLWDTSADDLVFAGAAGIDLAGDIDVDGTANLDVVDIDGAVDMASTLAVAGVSSFAVAANVAQVALTSSSNAVAWDASAAANAYHLTTENTTISAPTNAVEGAFICIEINHDGTTTVAWNAIFNFAADTAPTTTDTNAKTDILVFRYNGAIWQEVGRTLNIPES